MAILGGVTPDRQKVMLARFNRPIEVHPRNWAIVQVFRLCTMPQIGTFAGLASVMLDVREIESAARGWFGPRWQDEFTPHLIHGVRIVADAWCAASNKRLAKNR